MFLSTSRLAWGTSSPSVVNRQRAAAISWARSRCQRSRRGIMRAITPDRSQEKARWYQGQGRAMKAAIASPAKTHVRTVAAVPVRVLKMTAIVPASIPTVPSAMTRSLSTFQERTTAMPVTAGYVADRLKNSHVNDQESVPRSRAPPSRDHLCRMSVSDYRLQTSTSSSGRHAALLTYPYLPKPATLSSPRWELLASARMDNLRFAALCDLPCYQPLVFGMCDPSLRRFAGAAGRSMIRFIRDLSRPVVVPTESPQVRVRGGDPHKKPTYRTALPGTRRHGC